MTCRSELLHQAFVRILRCFLEDERIPFLGGNLEVTVTLEFLLGSVEPLLETGGIKDRRHQGG